MKKIFHALNNFLFVLTILFFYSRIFINYPEDLLIFKLNAFTIGIIFSVIIWYGIYCLIEYKQNKIPRKLFFHVLNYLLLVFVILTDFELNFVTFSEGPLLRKLSNSSLDIMFSFILWYFILNLIEYKKSKKRFNSWNEYRKLNKKDKKSSEYRIYYFKKRLLYNLIPVPLIFISLFVDYIEGNLNNNNNNIYLILIIAIGFLNAVYAVNELRKSKSGAISDN